MKIFCIGGFSWILFLMTLLYLEVYIGLPEGVIGVVLVGNALFGLLGVIGGVMLGGDVYGGALRKVNKERLNPKEDEKRQNYFSN